MCKARIGRAAGLGLGLLVLAAGAARADGAADLGTALIGGTPLLDARLRYERVEQQGLGRDAKALTLRTRFGYRTGTFRGFSALAEGEWVRALGAERFNDTVNGRTAFPVVADPDSLELNRLWLNYEGPVETTVKVGRQRIILDNARFFGNVGFRQNEQTFDAVVLANRTLPRTTARYAYVWRVNRIFGSNSPMGDFDSDSHVVNIAHDLVIGGVEIGRVTGYGYWLDLDQSPIGSTNTIGVRLSGSRTLSEQAGLELLYAGEFARQWDGEDNPGDYSLSYYLIEPGLRWRPLTVKLGYEVLEGNGTSAFQTPLATLHAFQGATDVFLVTPPNGIEDLYLAASVNLAQLWSPRWPELGASLSGGYHDFRAENTSADYGSEWSVKLAFTFRKRLGLSIEYAEYDADGFASDRNKLWLTLSFTY